MLYRKTTLILITLVMLVVLAADAFGRMSLEADQRRNDLGYMSLSPAHCLAGHRVGKIELGVNNNGTFGNQYTVGQAVDCFTGEEVPSCEYPKNSQISYLFGAAFWIGAVVGRDTLVSVGADGWQTANEMYPDEPPFGYMVYRSITDPESDAYEDAISEEDYISVYTDTLTQGVDNDFFGRPHMPLNIEVTEASYAWSYSYAEDFVLFDYKISNIGTDLLSDVYMGIYVDADVSFDGRDAVGSQDDICGFLETYPTEQEGLEYLDTVFIAFIADNDGDFDYTNDAGQKMPCPDVTATRIVRTPSDSLDVSFNWWIGNGNPSLDFGPRERPGKGRWAEEWRDFRTGGLGTPEGDANKYYQLRNREFDYDQIYTASIQINDTLWQYPNQDLAADFADGYDTRYLLSFGPFEISAGQTLPISFAYVAGEGLHTVEGNATQNLPDHPDQFYANLDFSDLALNARWASWVYDNPGVDTDGDGDFGDSLLKYDSTGAVIDTIWIRGDNVPDFRGASPPPAPEFWVTRPEISTIHIRWNGLLSETTKDVFSRIADFEGYRVYMSRDERAASYSMMQSYDQENYNKLVYDRSDGEYKLHEAPFIIDSLRCWYGESCDDENFNPLDYTTSHPYAKGDSMLIFEPQDYNASELGVTTDICKLYPKAPKPDEGMTPDSILNDQIPENDTVYLTDDGYFKYYEYEYTIENLLPTVPYYVNVTAFDYGSPESGLASLETSVTSGTVEVFPLPSWEDVQNHDLEVYVYPNPYRLDAGYRDRGFEGRVDTDRPPDRTREIHFANLPPKCTIRIYTLDGDLVRELEHNEDTGSGTDTHESWNMITRNTQMVVSGIYYWTVESSTGETQIGKLVVIM